MKIKSKSMRKKSVAILAGIAIAGAVGASAASLGGLGGDDLGADTGDVASCDTTGIDVAYSTSFDATAGEYMLDSIDLYNINANCHGQDYDLTVLLWDYDALVPAALPEKSYPGTTTVVLDATDTDADPDTGTMSIPTTGDGITAESVSGLAMSISGTTVAI